MMPAKSISSELWYLLHAILGGVLGIIASAIFLLIYYGQTFDMPVSTSVRFRSAVWSTVLIMLVVLCIYFRKKITTTLQQAFFKDESYEEDEDTDESQQVHTNQ